MFACCVLTLTPTRASGFGNLTTIGGVLTVQTNPALVSITGMKNVAAVTSITINGNNFLAVLPELVRTASALLTLVCPS